MSVSLKGLGRHFTYTHLSWTQGGGKPYLFLVEPGGLALDLRGGRL